jgi:predicted MFS family arabinose efflux permease
VLTGGILYGLGLGLMAYSANALVFAWIGGLLIGLALAAASFGVMIGPIAALVPVERRMAALGLLSAGGSLGQLFYPPFAQIAMGGIGWHATLIVLALFGLLIVPLAFVLRDPVKTTASHAAMPLGAAFREALAIPSFGMLTVGFFACGFHIAFFQTHFPAIVAHAGLAPSIGAAALAVVGAFNILGSFVFGRLADRFPKRYVLSAIYTLRGLAIVGFLALPVTAFSVIAFSSVLGLLWLSTVAPTSGIIAEKFGLQWVSALFGVVFVSHQIGAFFGAWLGGVVYDRTGSYDLMWIIAIAVAAFAALVHLPINERPVARLAVEAA